MIASSRVHGRRHVAAFPACFATGTQQVAWRFLTKDGRGLAFIIARGVFKGLFFFIFFLALGVLQLFVRLSEIAYRKKTRHPAIRGMQTKMQVCI